ncbi:MAG: PAS-domain containing protein, partial [Alphaproteobacteria bacterium]|nr:PAS-domain containing protein [Alphaproteobacteria bacterium]
MPGNEAGKRIGDGQAGAGRRVAPVLLTATVPLLDPSLAATLDHNGVAVSSAIALGGAALAVAAGIWALWEQHQAQRLKRSLRLSGARLRAMVNGRDALISAGREAVVVWGRDGQAPQSYGGGETLLDACLRGPEATELSLALDGLSDQGRAFSLIVHEAEGRAVSVRGRAVGAMVGVWLEPESGAFVQPFDFRAVLDALPIPVWLRDKTLSLVWGNRAFLHAVGLAEDADALAQQTALDKSERDLASTARADGQVLEAKRFAVIAGQRRALAFTHTPLTTGQIVGSAIDVTELSAAEARLQQHIDAHAETLDRLTTAVAIFDAGQKLTFYNQAFAQLWDLSEQFLDTRPSDGEILDQLREMRKLPEQRDYQSWKRSRLALYSRGTEFLPEEQWHLPGGRTLRVIAQPHPFGGLIFLYEDMSERFALETNYNTLIKAQSATLDTLQEAVAVFGTDGRLKLNNAAFVRLWELDPSQLEGEPHIQRLAEICARRFGNEAMWKKLVSSIASNADRQNDWGQMERSDKSVLS